MDFTFDRDWHPSCVRGGRAVRMVRDPHRAWWSCPECGDGLTDQFVVERLARYEREGYK